MYRLSVALLAVLLAVASVGTHEAPPATTPVLVELFTSEGCADCPSADALLDTLIRTQPIGGAAIIGLGQHVDYWDRLGWKDRFSSVALTERQRRYQARFRTESIYTPQMVVDGRAEFVGSDTNAARRAIERALTSPHGVVSLTDVTVDDGLPPSHGDRDRLRIGVSVGLPALPHLTRGDRADIVVAVTEDRLRSNVTQGENHGRTLTHAAVVRYLEVLAQVESDNSRPLLRTNIPVEADWHRDQLRVVVFVQEVRSRAILASASISLKTTGR